MDEAQIAAVAEYNMSQRKDNGPEGERAALDIENIITPEHLKMISSASGGFSFRPDPKLEQQFWQTGEFHSGYTNMNTKVIYYNPLHTTGVPLETLQEMARKNGVKEEKIATIKAINPWTPQEARGFLYHEAGHHSPEAIELQDKMTNNLKHVPIPESYKGDKQSEARFYGAVHSNVNNAVADIWLESFMGRKPYNVINKDITALNTESQPPQSYKGWSKPQQLLQAILRHRYQPDPNIKDKLDPDAYKSFQKINESGALKTVMDWRAFGYLAKENDRKAAMERKFLAYKEVFLPEYLKLMVAELEKRKEQKKQQKKGGGQSEQGQQGQEEPDQRGNNNRSSDVPLSKEEEQEIINQILGELEEAGKEMGSKAQSEEEKNKIEGAIKEIKDKIEQRHKGGDETNKPSLDEKPGEDLGADRLAERAEAMRQKDKERSQRGQAEAMQVRQESIQKWDKTKEHYKAEIESTASTLAEIFLDDRRKKIEYLRRQGEIVPGLEFEHVNAILSGDLDPQTRMELIRNLEFLQTQLEFIVDTSGSMTGEKIEKSIDTTVIITEGFKKTLEDLDAEGLIIPDDEKPFQIGVTKYSDTPERVTKLEDPLNDHKEVTIIEKLSEVGGGTEETGAFKQVYEQLKLNSGNVIKIIIVFTDGQGNREGVAPIMQQVERDNQVVFLVIGFGNSKEDADAIVDSYLVPLKEKNQNIFGFATDKPETALPYALDFLKREVGKRRS